MTVSDSRITRTYYQEDIQQILQIAIARQAYQGEFSREQLLEIADELEIPPECLQAAEQEWLAKQVDGQKRQEFNNYRTRRLKKRFGNYAIVSTFFILLTLISSGGLSWLLYISLFWGLFLGLDGWNTFQSQGEEYERAFQIWQRKSLIQRKISKLLDRVFKV